jgi:DNA-binding CsgD family transcriptional regulator
VLCLLPDTGHLEWFCNAAANARIVVPGATHEIGHEVRDFMDWGGEVRVGDQVKIAIVVVDREIAFLPGRPHANAEWGAVIRAPSVVQRLVAMFEAHWHEAQTLSGNRLMSDRQYEMIRMLASGMTDEAVARQLDISPRTVLRDVHQIMQQLGVRSRLELGARLAKLGVL